MLGILTYDEHNKIANILHMLGKDGVHSHSLTHIKSTWEAICGMDNVHL